MYRPNKRQRADSIVHCDGCGCGQPACQSCYPADVYPYGPPDYEEPLPAPPPAFAPRQPPPPADFGLDCDYMLSYLKEDTLRVILAHVARTSPSALAAITLAYEQLPAEDDDEEEEEEEEEEEDDIDFDLYSKRAWHVLNTSRYARGSGSEQYEASYDAFSQIEGYINAIGDEAGGSYRTKVSALETLRKIAKTILLGNDTLGHEVRKQFQHDGCLPELMLDIAQSMTPDEQRSAGTANSDGKGSLTEKVRWVHKEAKGYCLEGVDAFAEVLSLLSGEVVEKDGR